MPAAALDASAPGTLLSSTSTRTPSLARAHADAQPMTPPPTRTTSAVSGTATSSGLLCRRLVLGRFLVRFGDYALGRDACARSDCGRMSEYELGRGRRVDRFSGGARIDGGSGGSCDGAV